MKNAISILLFLGLSACNSGNSLPTPAAALTQCEASTCTGLTADQVKTLCASAQSSPTKTPSKNTQACTDATNAVELLCTGKACMDLGKFATCFASYGDQLVNACQ